MTESNFRRIAAHKIVRGNVTGPIDQNGTVPVTTVGTGQATIRIPYVPGYYNQAGHFIGAAPVQNTVVTVAQGDGGEWFGINPMISKAALAAQQIPNNALLITADRLNRLVMQTDEYTSIGSFSKNLKIDAKRSIISENFDTKFSIGEGSTSVDGVVRRDILVSDSFDNLTRRESHSFHDRLNIICLDPSSNPSFNTTKNNKNTVSGNGRNPAFVEKRSMVYEFAHQYDVGSDQLEAKRYAAQDQEAVPLKYARRQARTDVFSLSLEEPNYLIEQIAGTGVDIYGNVLDLNRNILPVGKETDLSFQPNQDKLETYKKIRTIERRSLAYHWELNARKGPTKSGIGAGTFDPHQIVPPPDVARIDDFSRQRSRFFFDIDKEGQFKLNVPASSETGNIPFLTRYESASTIDAQRNGTDADQYSFNGQSAENRDQRRDVYLDSFAYGGGSVSILDPENLTAFTSPIDRITNKAVKHGTIYHDIAKTANYFTAPMQSAILQFEYPPINTGISTLVWPDQYVSESVTISGPNANAGGRSGSFNFDGMIELNVGSNTVDKQSMWLDTHGGILGNIGRDLNHVSMGLSLTGDLLIQVGGCDVGGPGLTPGCTDSRVDSRFLGKNLAFRPGAVDIRVMTDNKEATVVRIDNSGVTITTPSDLRFVAAQRVIIKAGTSVDIDAEEINLYSGDPNSVRTVQRTNKPVA